MSTSQGGRQALTGTLTSATQTGVIYLIGVFNVNITGTATATVQLERTFDNGATWTVVSQDAKGTPASFQSSGTFAVSVVGEEPEHNVGYRLNCTSFTSGTITYRISQ